MIDVENLVKTYGPLKAVNNISFQVERGEVLGFLGPNGAGKSTTMKMITGFISPTSGTISVCGHKVDADPLETKRRIGYLPEGAPAYPDMTAIGYLKFIADVRRLRGARRQERLDYAIDRIGLHGVLQQPIETLSKGYKRRVGLAQAVLHDPEVLILDEPTDGLDPNQKHEVRGLIREMSADKAIIISTHILEEVDAVCSRAVIIARGRIVADGTPHELQARSRLHNAVALRVSGAPLADIATDIETIHGIARVETEQSGRLIVVPATREPILDTVSAHIKNRGWDLTEFRVEPGRLDDVFRDITMTAE